MQAPIKIHRFYRGFIKVKKGNDYVSGGYDSKVYQPSQEVPELIKQCIKNDDYAIPDTHCPQNNDIALVAWEIQKYSVLAVSSEMKDDKGGRETNAYTYFWLETEDDRVDGILTLLNWWLKSEQPQFDWYQQSWQDKETKSCLKRNDGHNKQLPEKLLNEISSESPPYLSTKETLNIDAETETFYTEFHTLARVIQKIKKVPDLAWAFNVRKLDQPQNFLFVLCHDDRSANDIKSDLKNKTNYDYYRMPADIRNEIGNLSTKITKYLLNRPNKWEENLLNILKTTPSENWDWDTILDNRQTTSNQSTKKSANSRALIAIFKPKYSITWLNWLSEKPNRRYQKDSLKFQEKTVMNMYAIHKDLDFLKEKIRSQISCLLYELLTSSLQEAQELYEKIEWLLIKSKSVWSYQFKVYAKFKVLPRLIGEKETPDDDIFVRELRDFIDKNKRENQVYQFSRLANLFETVTPDLARQFSSWAKLSGQSNSSQLKIASILFKAAPILIVIVLLMAVVSLLLVPESYSLRLENWIFSLFYNRASESQSSINLSIETSLEKELYHQQESNNVTPKSQYKTVYLLENLIQAFEETPSALTGSLTEVPTYQELKSLFLPDVPPNLEQGSSGELVYLLNDILQKNNYEYSEDYNNFNGRTKRGVTSFQQQHNLTPTGKVDRQTWEKLLGYPSYVENIARFLKRTYENEYEEALVKVKSLQRCKSQVILTDGEYGSCLLIILEDEQKF